jgi:carbon monoxide dehydrogenase subunit G
VKIENSFEVPAARAAAWELLMDVPRVVPCMPGATLTETVDENQWKADMSVKLGPIALVFATDVTREGVDEAAGTVTLNAKAREKRGRGGAQAAIQSTLTEAEAGTRIDIVTDLTLSGAVAQYGRGIVQDVSAQLVSRFADCLRAQLAVVASDTVESRAQAEAAVAQQAKPVGGVSLGAGAVARAFGRFVRRLLGR